MSNKGKFVVGAIVKLKSGGPEMTVKEAVTNLNGAETGNYRCQWFAGKKLDSGVFPYESLVAATKED